MSTVLNLAMSELSRAEKALEDAGFEGGMAGYMMSRGLWLDDVAWAEHAAKALIDWVDAKRQVQEAKRVATWNPEHGWKTPGAPR